MKCKPSHLFFGLVAALFILSCQSEEERAEGLAKQYCASCHMFPEPTLLDKKTWRDGVLPQMAFRMGVETDLLQSVNEADMPEVLKAIPARPMVSEEQWQAIKNYYTSKAPDSLIQRTRQSMPDQHQFNASGVSLPTKDNPLITFVRFDSIQRKIFLGSRLSKMYRTSTEFVVEDSFKLYSPPSSIFFYSAEEALIANMGIMDPNDQPVGRIVNLTFADKHQYILADSIKRPVDIQYEDLNNDGLKDMVVCAFGNYTGSLSAYERKDGKYVRHSITELPGSRRTIVRDFDNDGLKDILALITQGDEKIVMFKNLGKFNFSQNVLLRFPPVYGSSDFGIYDFNNDGRFDILYTNGDNADYSSIFKPYHGVRLFMNDGDDKFSEQWFSPMYGASEALAGDYDGDGDVDICAISFFPDFAKHPEYGFFYFENVGGKFVAQKEKLAASGRWLTMEQADIDNDGDLDVMLGALDFTANVPATLLARWKNERTSLLVLKNNLR